jgi:uncharacterized membrane protein
MGMMLPVHVVAGALGIVFGFVALYAAKGARLHRRSGMLFVYALLTMCFLGALLAAVRGKAPESNVPMALLTAYLVITGLTTVRTPSAGSRALDLGLMLVASVVGLALFTFGVKAFASPRGSLHGIPALAFFTFGSVALLASVGDLRLIGSGGVQALRGAPRLTRHLWRMSFALLIAAFSFSRVIPKSIRIVPLPAVPALVVLATLLYWLWRIRIRRSVPGMVGISASPAQISSILPPPARRASTATR